MKIIIFFCFFISILLANTNNLDVPSYIEIDNVKTITQKGWREAKKPLISFFNNDGKIFEESFFDVAKKSYIHKSEKKNMDQLQKAHLTRADIYYALAYAKYLEYIGKTKTSLDIYKVILIDVKDYATKDLNTPSLITRFVVGNIVRKSLDESLKHNLYSQKEKKTLYHFLQGNLLFDTNDFPKILESERSAIYRLCKEHVRSNDYIGRLMHGMVPESDRTINKAIDTTLDYLSNRKFSEEDMKNICTKMDKKNNIYYKEVNAITRESDAENFEIKLKNGEQEYYERIQYINIEKDILVKEHDYLIGLVADTFFYTSFAKWSEIKLNLVGSIYKNKKMVESLK